MASSVNGVFVNGTIVMLIVLVSFLSGFIISAMFGVRSYNRLMDKVIVLKRERDKLLRERKVSWIDND